MLESTSRLERAVLLIACLWTCTFDSFGCSNQTVCEYTESYDEVVTVSVNELVHVTKNKWCLSIPPRCPDNEEEFRTVQKNITVPKTRVIKKCCKDSFRLYNTCISKCTEKQCPNIQCKPDTDRCECKPGYIGHLCMQRCGVGRWGPSCQNSCHVECSDCDHRTGCCMTAWAIREVKNRTTPTMALTFCADRTTVAPASTKTGTPARTLAGTGIPARTEMPAGTEMPVETGFKTSDEFGTGTPDVTGTRKSVGTRMPAGTETRTSTESGTWMPSGTGTPEVPGTPVDESTVEAPRATAVGRDASSSSIRRENGGTYTPVVTTVEVKVYRFDDLVKKLVWISAMTVAAIAMVFVIMFVVFFNCDGASGASDGAKNRRRSTSASVTDPRIHETCIGTHKLGHVTLDRYTKTPGLRTPTNNDLPIHPEIFCPVFSAPHHASYTNTGSSLYDSPQPLYEILC